MLENLTEQHLVALGGRVPPAVIVTSRVAAALGQETGLKTFCVVARERPAGFASLTADGEVIVTWIADDSRGLRVGTYAGQRLVECARALQMTQVHARARKGSGGDAIARSVGMEQVGEDAGESHFKLSLE